MRHGQGIEELKGTPHPQQDKDDWNQEQPLLHLTSHLTYIRSQGRIEGTCHHLLLVELVPT